MSQSDFLNVSRVSIFGLALSFYTVYVEYKAHTAHDDNPYVALCDLSEKMSCSKVFLSEYGKIFSSLGIIPKDSILDQPNAVYGIVLYALVYTVATTHKKLPTTLAQDILLVCATASVLLSAYLSYILSEVLQDVCVVCFSTYVVNFILFFTCSRMALRNEPEDSHVKVDNDNDDSNGNANGNVNGGNMLRKGDVKKTSQHLPESQSQSQQRKGGKRR